MLVKCIAILMYQICFLYRKMHGRPRGLRKLQSVVIVNNVLVAV